MSLEKNWTHAHEEAALSVLHRIVEWPELEWTHKDWQSPAPHLAQDNPSNHTQNTQTPTLTWEGPEIQTIGGGKMHGEVQYSYSLPFLHKHLCTAAVPNWRSS